MTYSIYYEKLLWKFATTIFCCIFAVQTQGLVLYKSVFFNNISEKRDCIVEMLYLKSESSCVCTPNFRIFLFYIIMQTQVKNVPFVNNSNGVQRQNSNRAEIIANLYNKIPHKFSFSTTISQLIKESNGNITAKRDKYGIVTIKWTSNDTYQKMIAQGCDLQDAFENLIVKLNILL